MSREESCCLLRVKPQRACSGFQGPLGSSLSPFSLLLIFPLLHSILAALTSVLFLQRPGLLPQEAFAPSFPSAPKAPVHQHGWFSLKHSLSAYLLNESYPDPLFEVALPSLPLT